MRTSIHGLVDLQVNGWKGVDFSSPDLNEEGVVSVIRAQLANGTGIFLPTIITSPLEVYQRNLMLIARVISQAEFAPVCPGIHVEGPFISPVPGAVGAHNADWTRQPDAGLLTQLQKWAEGRIRLLTLAPELPGSQELMREARDLGMLVSLGHTLATAADMSSAQQAGASLLTHLGNGLPPSLPKFENPLWAGLTQPSLIAMFIGDGHHIPQPILHAMLRAKGLRNSLIVSDAAPAAGLPPGRHVILGNPAILTPEGRLYNPEKGNLVGSSFCLRQCLNSMAAFGELSLRDLLWLGAEHPRRVLNLPDPSNMHPLLVWDETNRSFSLSS